MQHPFRFSSLALVLVLLGCGGDSSGPEPVTLFGCETGRTYNIGRTVNGTLDADDCLDPGDNGWADYYQFTLGSDGPVSIPIRANTGSVPLIIAIFDADEMLVDFDFVAPGTVETLGGQFFSGTYILVVAAEEPNRTGSYSVSSSAVLPPVFGCSRLTPLTIGVTVTGNLASTDCLDPLGEASADYYEFTLNSQGPVSFTVTPAGDGMMVAGLANDREFLFDVQVATNADPVTLGGMLPRGRYIVIVGGMNPGQTGGYTVSSSATLPPAPEVPPFMGCTQGQAYAIGTSVNGTLASTDCTDSDGAPLDRYDFTLATSRTVTFNLQSTAFDSYLYLFDAEGVLIAFNDDAPGTLNSRLTIALPAGSYAIGASAYDFDAAGPYTLSTTSMAAVTSDAMAIESGTWPDATRGAVWPSAGSVVPQPHPRAAKARVAKGDSVR